MAGARENLLSHRPTNTEELTLTYTLQVQTTVSGKLAILWRWLLEDPAFGSKSQFPFRPTTS
jgi:hypothetical protein